MQVLSTSAQLNPKPKMLWCPQSGHHSILGFGFNYDHRLMKLDVKLRIHVQFHPSIQQRVVICEPLTSLKCFNKKAHFWESRCGFVALAFPKMGFLFPVQLLEGVGGIGFVDFWSGAIATPGPPWCSAIAQVKLLPLPAMIFGENGRSPINPHLRCFICRCPTGGTAKCPGM